MAMEAERVILPQNNALASGSVRKYWANPNNQTAVPSMVRPRAGPIGWNRLRQNTATAATTATIALS